MRFTTVLFMVFPSLIGQINASPVRTIIHTVYQAAADSPNPGGLGGGGRHSSTVISAATSISNLATATLGSGSTGTGSTVYPSGTGTSGGPLTVTVQNSGSATFEVYFTPNAGLAEFPSMTITPGGSQTSADMGAWCGNLRAVVQGQGDAGASVILAEICLNQKALDTDTYNNYYDVSAISCATCNTGIHYLYPQDGSGPQSGCDVFSTKVNCAYVKWDDVQTKASGSGSMVVVLK